MEPVFFDVGFLGSGMRYGSSRMSCVAVVACSNCGQIMGVTWKTNAEDGALNVPSEAKQKISICPICGHKTPLKKEYSISSLLSTRAKAVKQLEQQLEDNAKLASRKAVTSWLTKLPVVPELPSDNPQAQKLIEDTAILKEYILNILSAESAVYILSEQIAGLYKAQKQNDLLINAEIARRENEQKELAQKQAIEAERKRNEKVKGIKKEIAALRKKIAAYKSQIAEQKKLLEETDWSAQVTNLQHPQCQLIKVGSLPVKPLVPAMKKPGLFNKKKIEQENADMTQQYEAQLAAYHAACAEREAAERENQKRRCQYQEALAIYNKRLEEEAAAQKEKTQIVVQSIIQDLKKKIEDISLRISQKEAEIEAIAVDDCSDESEIIVEDMPCQNEIVLFLRKEIKEAEAQLRNAVKIRGQLYSYGIIHNKYRNQVALSTIYEYLDTGRCCELGGAAGAYNLFESECRSNLIISQLTQVIDTLEEIKKNQYMIYAELKQISKKLDQLNEKMDQAITELQSMRSEMNIHLQHISDNTDALTESNQQILTKTAIIAENTKAIEKNTAVTAYYTAVTAHYSKINAQLTNAVGFMLALK